MIDRGRRNLLGVLIDAVDYEAAVERTVAAAREPRPFRLSAMAVHGVMTGALDPEHRFRLNRFDLLVPDGQPVRWALNLLHRTALPDRVYGPTLMLKLCARMAAEELPVFLYGSRPPVLDALEANLLRRFPGLRIAGALPSRFQRVSEAEQQAIAEAIRQSGARLVLVGLGCPRQEVWAFENAPLIGIPAAAVGAAFDFHAGLLPQAPPRLQALGLEWLFRLVQEPKRLWRRYLLLNPRYVWLVALQGLGIRRVAETAVRPPAEPLRYA